MSEQRTVTPAEVVGHLRESGSSESRCRLVEEWIGQNPEADASQLLEWMVIQAQAGDKNIRRGTVEKAGKFIVGPAFAIAMPGESFSDEVNRLRIELDRVQRENVTLNKTAGQYLRELTARRNELMLANEQIAQLKAERDHWRSMTPEASPLPSKPAAKRGRGKKEESQPQEEEANLQPVG